MACVAFGNVSRHGDFFTSYTRGVDLSGSLQGAGGIGGMLGMTTHTNTTNYTHYFYHSDGAGNITALMDTNQVVQAQYAYEPFGNLWSQSGALTNLSRYRSSSKEWHPQSDMYFYPFRIYAPDFQRWLTEDPIGNVATNSMVCATYFKTVPEAASRYLRPAEGGTAFSYHQNASTHGPPTSSAVQVNLGQLSGSLAPPSCPANRVRNATASGSVGCTIASRRASVNQTVLRRVLRT